MSTLSIEVKKIDEGMAEIHVIGDLDANSYEDMEAKFEEIFAQGCYKLICNLEKVDYISSAGAGVFLSALDTAEEHQGNIALLRPSKAVQDVFDILGLLEILPCAQTLEEAVKFFQDPY